ncbi:DHA2 family efflux MFS transporter permease subunit [Chloroflexota bacterium]
MEEARYKFSYKWIVLSVVAIGTLMATLDAGMVRIALPHLSSVFQVGPNTVVWVLLVYLLICTGLMLTLGRAADTFGRKRLYTLGLVIFSLGLGLCALAQSFIQLVIFRLIQAVGAAMVMAIGDAILTASFPSKERGRALGIMGAVIGAGLLSGPALGGILLDFLDWRSIFYLRLPLGVVGAIMAWVLLKQQVPSGQKRKFDLPGAATLFVALACLFLALNQGQSLGWFQPWVVALGVMVILFAFLFVLFERRAEHPVLDLRLFLNRLFSAASGSHSLVYMATEMVGFLLPFLLIQAMSFSASLSGLLMATIPAWRLVLSPLSGRLSDKLGTLFFCSSGFVMVSAGIFLLTGLGLDASVVDIFLRLSVVGIGMGLFVSPNNSAIMGSVPGDKLGTASAMVATLRQAGTATGVAIAGTVFAASQLSHGALLESQELSQEMVTKLSIVAGFGDATLVALIVAGIGLVTSLLRGKR